MVITGALILSLTLWRDAAAAEELAREQARQARLQAERATRSEAEARRIQYAANMNLVQHDWEQSNLVRLWSSLEETESYSDRGFEWFYWQYRMHRSLKTFRGHLDRIGAVAVSPDGRLIATASNDQTVKVWGITSGREWFTFRGHTAWVRSVVFFPDGKKILTSSDDLTARVWDIATRRELLVLQGRASAHKWGIWVV